MWIEESGWAKQFYKGLIQAAVALHHLENGNAHGAKKLLQGSQRYLDPYRSWYLGLDVDGFLAAMSGWVEDWLAGEGESLAPGLRPTIELHPRRSDRT